MDWFIDGYLELVTGEFRHINLTRIVDPKEFKEKQYYDSLRPFLEFNQLHKLLNEAVHILDVGFGGGFPILPLAVNFPKKQLIGIDARMKKVLTVSEIAAKLNINNAKFYHARLEEILIDRPVLLTFKAVGKTHNLLSRINIQEDVKVHGVFYKGPNYHIEDKLQIPDWELIKIYHYSLADQSQRNVLLFSNVPRGTAKKNQSADKNLVKLSELI